MGLSINDLMYRFFRKFKDSGDRLPVDVGGEINIEQVNVGEIQQGARGQNAEPWEVILTGQDEPLEVWKSQSWEYETIFNDVLAAESTSDVLEIDPKGAPITFLVVNVDKQPWGVRLRRNIFGAGQAQSANRFWPNASNVDQIFPIYSPGFFVPLMYSYAENSALEPENLQQALAACIPGPIEIDFFNRASETANVRLRVLRIWR